MPSSTSKKQEFQPRKIWRGGNGEAERQEQGIRGLRRGARLPSRKKSINSQPLAKGRDKYEGRSLATRGQTGARENNSSRTLLKDPNFLEVTNQKNEGAEKFLLKKIDFKEVRLLTERYSLLWESFRD